MLAMQLMTPPNPLARPAEPAIRDSGTALVGAFVFPAYNPHQPERMPRRPGSWSQTRAIKLEVSQ